LSITIVARVNAITARSWFAVPNILMRARVPPSRSTIPHDRISPHPTTERALVVQTGTRRGSASFPRTAAKSPSTSWTTKRITRVPESSTVSMKTASNMIAKWYQKAAHAPPRVLEKMWAIPTASEGPPPARL